MPKLRDYFLLDPNIIYLNHGSFGATPGPVFEEYQRWQLELERGPVEFLSRRHDKLMSNSRAVLGEYLGTDARNLVYVQNVTIALNIVAHSLDLGAGDEVLTTNHEYGAMDRTWRFLSKERGFNYKAQQVDLTSHGNFVDSFWQGVGENTRVIFMSHITSPTATIFPIEEIIIRAREKGIITVIDGAHVAGQLPLNLDSLGADFYGGNLHKWLCAPKGSGFLYARPKMQHLLKPLVVSWGYESDRPSGSEFIDHHEWWGTRDVAAFLSVPAAIEFQKLHHWDDVRKTCHQLLIDTWKRINSLTGMKPVHDSGDEWFAQMAVSPLPHETDIIAMKEKLFDEYHIEVPLLEWQGNKLLRLSVQGYNTQQDLDALISALGKLLK